MAACLLIVVADACANEESARRIITAFLSRYPNIAEEIRRGSIGGRTPSAKADDIRNMDVEEFGRQLQNLDPDKKATIRTALGEEIMKGMDQQAIIKVINAFDPTKRGIIRGQIQQ